jgi:DNA-binding transcriptional LysR family regulator
MVLDLRRLRILRELSRRGTLGAVADALGYSPSTISQQLSQLEAEAGAPLLEPAGRRVRLTPAAEILVRHTEVLLSQMEQAEADLAAVMKTGLAAVRVASFQSAALALMPAALTHLVRAHPSLRVELTVLEPEVSLPALVARDFDLAVIEEYPHRPLPRSDEIERCELLRDELLLAVPAAGWPSRLAELAGRPWVMEPEGTRARDWTAATCRSAGFEPDVRYTCTDLVMHAALVASGHAAALLPVLSGISASTGATVIPLSDRPERRVFTAIRRGAEKHPAIVAIRAALDAARLERRGRAGPTPPL